MILKKKGIHIESYPPRKIDPIPSKIAANNKSFHTGERAFAPIAVPIAITGVFFLNFKKQTKNVRISET